MDREQIIKALELHSQKMQPCLADCPYGGLHNCESDMAQDALSLINELTQKLECANLEIECKERILESYMIQYGTVADKEVWLKKERADTVRKMQTEIESRCIKGGIYPAFVKRTIEKVAEEMLGGDNGNKED